MEEERTHSDEDYDKKFHVRKTTENAEIRNKHKTKN